MVRHGVFRDGGYARYVFWGKRTVKQGECLSQWNLDGKQKLIVGPRRKYLWRSNIRFLDRHQADQHQYLVILHRDGRKEHIRGPVALFEDPVLHQRISVENVLSVDGFEALVVYREDVDSKGRVERRVVRGPTQFVPDANEWVHEFIWHGPDQQNADKLVAGGSKFTKLKTIPGQINYQTEVRTHDDVLLILRLIVFYEMDSIEEMLNSTSDPIGDMANALGADLITFAAKVSYERFLEVSSISLNDVSTFPLLAQRAQSIGFSVNKVVYRGYKASREMQAMHEEALQAVNRIQANHDAAIKEQELEDLKLARTAARSEKVRATEAAEHAEKMRKQAVEHEAIMRQQQLEADFAEMSMKRGNEERIAYLQGLKTLGVNLTEYLVAEKSKVDKVVRVETTPGVGSTLLIDTDTRVRK